MEPFEPLVIWDLEDDPDGNYVHIVVDHGVTQDELQEIMREVRQETVESYSSGRPATFGWTSSGKYIIVIWDQVHDDPWTIYPVTSYEVAPPRSKRKKRRNSR